MATLYNSAQASGGGTDLGVCPPKPPPTKGSGLTLSALQLLEAGAVRWGGWYPGAHPWPCPMGLREARCDLIFLTVLSLVLLGCRGGSLSSPHQNGGVMGGDWKNLNFLLKPFKPLGVFLF